MKPILYSLAFLAVATSLPAQTPVNSTMKSTNAPELASTVFDWEKMHVETTTNGVRRTVFDAPTTTLDKIHCHITTLNPGQNSGAPRRHLQEEVIVIKEG